MTETVQVAREGPLAVVTLNRPSALNAISNVLISALTRAMGALSAEQAVRVAILTGAGNRAFCSGMDLKERATLSDADLVAQRATMAQMFEAVRLCAIPLIAAVRGYAIGGGLELALSCDFIYCTPDAVFGFPEVTRGIMPGGGATQLLPRRIGTARARELIFTGEQLDAAEAQRIGLVNRVVPSPELLPAVKATARLIADNAPLGVRQSKFAMASSPGQEAGIALESEAYWRVLHSVDRREGYAAFVEKRKPRFTGK